MTINDLEVGQFVKLKNGNIYIIGLSVNARLFKEKKDKLILIDILRYGDTYDSMTCYSNEMTHYRGYENLAIIQVANDYNFKDVIWTRDEPILTESEKEYLSNVIKPFRDRVEFIGKCECSEKQFIGITVKDGSILLPLFEKNKYYQNMEVNKKYTLEELGL